MRLKFYIIISLIIHLIVSIFAPTNFKKERLKGEKITPIEIINNASFNSLRGNASKNSLKKIQNNKNTKVKKDNKLQKTKEFSVKDKSENNRGDFQINKKEANEKNKKSKKEFLNEKQVNNLMKKKSFDKSAIKDKALDSKKISAPQEKGFSNKDKEKDKDIEKGSIKGKGNLKITCLNCVSPKYPRKALKKGLEGKPTVKVWIYKNGDVEKVELIKSSGILSIDNAALEAAQRSKFYPMEIDSFINIEYDLKLK